MRLGRERPRKRAPCGRRARGLRLGFNEAGARTPQKDRNDNIRPSAVLASMRLGRERPRK